MAGAFNLFQLLELNPAARWDEAAFAERLKQKQHEWSRLTNHPKKAMEAKRCIGLIPQLREVAADAQLRAQHAQAATSQQAAQQEELQRSFEDELSLLQVKGFLLSGEVAELVKKFAQLGPEARLRKQMRVPIKEKAPVETASAREGLDPSVARAIHEDLAELHKKDLYDFLELDASTSVTQLHQRADEIYKSAQRRANKDAETTLRGRLAGQCRACFDTAQNKARYDATLENARFDSLRERADKAAAQTKTLTAGAVELLLKSFRGAGGSNTEVDGALEVLRVHAKKKGYALEIPQGAVEKAKAIRRCGYCDTVNETSLKHCTQCGRPLEEPCPKCGVGTPTEQGACGNCGFPCGNRRHVDVLCQEASSACNDRNLELAEARCAQAAADWATGHGELAERIASLRKLISTARAAQARFIEELRQEIRERRYFRAEKRLRESAAAFPPGAPELAPDQLTVQNAIADANRALQRARVVTGATTQKVDAYSQILAIAVDCQEALEALAAFPPDPPANLQAKVEGAQVRLAWRVAVGQGVASVVLRRSHSRPTGNDAGEVVATTQGGTLQDASPEIGVPMYYVVMSERGGVRSRSGAQLQKPIVVLDEVKELRADVGSGQVTLTWKKPATASRVIVRRGTADAPSSVGDGIDVSVAPNGCTAIDLGLRNGERYQYSIFAQFDVPAAGGLLTTSGLRVAMTPEEPPLPVDDLVVTSDGDTTGRRVQVSWKAPPRGQVVIFAADRPFNLKSGERRLSADLKSFRHPLPGVGERCSEVLTGQRARYYLPVTLLRDFAVVGREHVYRNVEECSNLTCQNVGTALRVKWDWPSSCTQVRVGHDSHEFVTDREAAVVTLAQYQVRGYVDIPNPSRSDQRIVVFAEYPMPDGSLAASAGCRKTVRVGSRVTVRYEIRKPLFGRALKLKLEVVGEGAVPPMVMVRKARVLPTKRSEGEQFLRIEAIPAATRHVELAIPSDACGHNLFGQLFLEDDGDYDFVTLQKPALDRLRLF